MLPKALNFLNQMSDTVVLSADDRGPLEYFIHLSSIQYCPGSVKVLCDKSLHEDLFQFGSAENITKRIFANQFSFAVRQIMFMFACNFKSILPLSRS